MSDYSRNGRPNLRIISDQQSQQIARLGPHSTEAEEAVLGSILIGGNIALHDVVDIVEPDDFFELRHQWIYSAMLDIDRSGADIDYITVCDALRQIKGSDGQTRLEALGGSSYLTYLVNGTPAFLHVETYAQLIETASVRRRMMVASGEIAQLAREENDILTNIIMRAESIFGNAIKRTGQRQEMSIANAASEVYDRVIARYEDPSQAIGLPTMLPDLDNLLLGLRRGELTVIAARPKVGKTAFMLNIAQHLMRMKYIKVAFFSLEMDVESLMLRMMASEAGINSQKLRAGRLTADEISLYTEATGRVSEWGGFVEFVPGINITQLKRRASMIKRKHGLDLIVLDYLQIMSGDGRENRAQEVGQITAGLKQLAGVLGVPVLTASQINREVEKRTDKRPMLADMRESGSVEQDADVVIGLYRDDLYNPDSAIPGEAEVIVLANRHGPTGTVKAKYIPHLTRFEPVRTIKFE